METTHTTTRLRSRSSEGPTGADLLEQMSQLNQTISSMIMDGLSQLSSTTRAPAPAARRKDHLKECRECEHDECECRCCIGDADLVVYARLFERRIVPITLVNERRREKQIHLELSEFKTRGGDSLGIKAAILPPHDFTLAPCGEQHIILVIDSLPAGAAGDDVAGRMSANAQERRLPDVDECKVLYADLRVEGCDLRPVRIALALLPRDCADFEIECGCSCC
jgi:hypothetical protein